jgi:hypothetical protein
LPSFQIKENKTKHGDRDAFPDGSDVVVMVIIALWHWHVECVCNVVCRLRAENFSICEWIGGTDLAVEEKQR